jgi:hypothetical protein
MNLAVVRADVAVIDKLLQQWIPPRVQDLPLDGHLGPACLNEPGEACLDVAVSRSIAVDKDPGKGVSRG